MQTSFPVSLSPSPVHHAFDGIQGDPIEKLSLSGPEKSLIRNAEDNVLEYTLQQPADAMAYAQVLLKLIDSLTSSPKDSNAKVHKLPLEAILPDDEALPLLYVDAPGVLIHYLIQRLCDVVLTLRAPDNGLPKVSMATVFYPDGILLEHARSLLRVLVGGPTDVFAQRGAAVCLGCLLMEGQSLEKNNKLLSSISPILESFVSWMTSRLQSGSPQSLTVVSPALTIVIIDQGIRELMNAAGGIGYLARNLQAKQQSASVQQLYELAYCLWVLSFNVNEHEALRLHFHRDGAVPALVDLVAAAPREKAVRVALSALCNLATCDPLHSEIMPLHKRSIDGAAFLTEMVGCGLIKAIDLLKQKAWKDEEVIKGTTTDERSQRYRNRQRPMTTDDQFSLFADLNLLSKLLHDTAHDMTRWDVYMAEVNSGHLQWGMLHTEKFFKENAKSMEGPNADFAIVKVRCKTRVFVLEMASDGLSQERCLFHQRLIQLAASDDEDVASVACYDIGEFARFYPNGRSIAKRLGVRNIVMHLMDSPHEELRRQALLCTSKILVQNWQHVS